MKTYVKVTYLAIDEEKIPITTAANFEDLKAGVDDYYGIGVDDKAKYLTYKPYDSQYWDIYQGYFEYETNYVDEVKIEKIYVYCLDFYPHTIIGK